MENVWIFFLQSMSEVKFRTFEALPQPHSSRPSDVIDMENYGVNVLSIEIPPGNTTISVLVSPRWTDNRAQCRPVWCLWRDGVYFRINGSDIL